MKITRNAPPPPQFRPIAIELETKDEAKTLWHILNNTGDLDKYWNRQGDKNKGRMYRNCAAALWKALDGVYSPGE